MTRKRILTAREQYELLSPWHTAAAPTLAPEETSYDYFGPVVPKPIQPKAFSSEDVGSPQDVLGEWSQKRSDPQAPPGPREPIAPWANKLEQALYNEFMNDWWPNSKASQERSPEGVYTGWRTFPQEPITHWLNVEDFLGERYPEAATGSQYGLEDADEILDIGQRRGWDVPQDILDQKGYLGSGNVITQAMLNLHNKLQGRTWANDKDKYRYYELMLKHVGPGAKRLSKLLRTAYKIAAEDDVWHMNWDEPDPYVGKHRKKKEPSRLEKWLRSWHPDQIAQDLAKTAGYYYDDTPYWAAAWDGWDDDDDDDDEEPPKRKKTAEQAKLEWQHNFDDGSWELVTFPPTGPSKTILTEDTQPDRMWKGGSFKEAMADTTKWHPIIRHEPIGPKTGLYHITIPDEFSTTGKRIGDLFYTRGIKGEKHYFYDENGGYSYKPRENNEAYIESVIVHPDYRGQGVAQALVERLAKDFPDHKINPGATTPEGQGFTQRMMEIAPEAKEKIAPNYKPYILDDDDVENFNNEEMQRLLNARFWKQAMPAEDAYDPSPNQYQREQADMPLRENASGKWYHVSPHKIEPGTNLTPGGGKGPYPYEESSVRPDWVWMDGPEGVRQWYYGTLMGQIQQGNESPWAHIYEVEPDEGPHPWNGSGWEGHVAPSARVIREIPTDKYNRLPDHLGHNKTAIELSDEDSQKLIEYLKNNKIKFTMGEPEKVRGIPADALEKMFAPMQPTGKWYHVSPHEMEPGTSLIAGGPEGNATSKDFYDMGFGDDSGTLQDMGGGRTKHIWVTPDLEDAHFWSAALNAPHIYEVDTDDDPQPWNGTGTDGWVTPSARIRSRIN